MKEVAGITFTQTIKLRFAGSLEAMLGKSAWHRRIEENCTVRAAGRIASMTLARGGEVRMAEYIDREKAIEAFTFADADVCQEYGDYECEFGFSREAIKDVLKSVETADVVPVVHENWIIKTIDYGISPVTNERVLSPIYKCGGCGYDTGKQAEKFNYCPICGAKMDL